MTTTDEQRATEIRRTITRHRHFTSLSLGYDINYVHLIDINHHPKW